MVRKSFEAYLTKNTNQQAGILPHIYIYSNKLHLFLNPFSIQRASGSPQFCWLRQKNFLFFSLRFPLFSSAPGSTGRGIPFKGDVRISQAASNILPLLYMRGGMYPCRGGNVLQGRRLRRPGGRHWWGCSILGGDNGEIPLPARHDTLYHRS